MGQIGDDQGLAYFGAAESGLSDVSASATVNYQFDSLTTFYLSVNGVSAIDSELEDALDAAGLDDAGFWLALGVSWSL